MTRALLAVLAIAIASLSGCATSSPPPPPSGASSTRAPVGEVRRLAVVPSGESTFTVVGTKLDAERTLDEVVKWMPRTSHLFPLAKAVQWGLNWLTREGRSAAASRHVGGIVPGAVVADAFARTLRASGRFDQIRTLEREPTGEERRQIDALVRVTVPAWGVIRVREGKPDMMAAFADAHVHVAVRPTGVVVWEHDEDVTHPERLPLPTLTGDGEVLRQALKDVLERAGQRLANELVYARSAGW